jgi:hypothetical protein
MNVERTIIAIAALLVAPAATGQAEEAAKLTRSHRWGYLSTNMLVEEDVSSAIAILRRAAEADYTGAVLTDSKFMRWDRLARRCRPNPGRGRRDVLVEVVDHSARGPSDDPADH